MTMNHEELGPLASLVGNWAGERGRDISPSSSGGSTQTDFRETLEFVPVGAVKNAAIQELRVVRYHQQVYRLSDGAKFHDQVGYWSWEPAKNEVIQTLTIPRAMALLAGGVVESDTDHHYASSLKVASMQEGPWPIIQSPFLSESAKTIAYELHLKVQADELSYEQTTSLMIYGRAFEHRDRSVLTRVV